MFKFKSPLFRALFSLGMMRFGIEGEGGGGAPTPPAPAKPQTFSLEYVQELREENKALRLKNKEVTDKVAELTTAAEKAGKDADEKVSAAEKAANDKLLRSELKAHALKAGLVDLDGLKLADLSSVKLNDKGEVEGADKLFTDLKTAKPYLFGAASSSTPKDPPPNNPPGPKHASEYKTPQEYQAAKQAFLAGSR
jgi:hypothetical protein